MSALVTTTMGDTVSISATVEHTELLRAPAATVPVVYTSVPAVLEEYGIATGVATVEMATKAMDRTAPVPSPVVIVPVIFARTAKIVRDNSRLIGRRVFLGADYD